MYALTNCTLYTSDLCLTDHALVIDGNRIIDVLPTAQIAGSLQRLDGQGYGATPGFIDLQLNGCGGVMFNDAMTADTLAVMHRTNLHSGTTSYLPTLITTSDADMEAAMALMQTYRQSHPYSVLGLHLEGPYLNPKRKGIHNGAYVRAATAAMIKTLTQAGPEVVRLLTLAPEMTPPEYIRQLADAGILVAAGHTDASFEAAIAGFDAGIGMATHLFNAMSPWQGRQPGMVGAVFSHPEVYAGIIADGHHVHFGSIALAQRIKGERLILVSDATPPAGARMESFMIGGQQVFYRDGKCVSADGTLGGSALTLITAIANCVRHCEVPLETALRMASLYPARALRLDHQLGRLSPGYMANITLFDPQTLTIQGVIDQGIYQQVEPEVAEL